MRRVGIDVVFPFLAAKLTDPDVDVRCGAVTALLFVDTNQAMPLVLPMLGDPDSIVRWHTGGCLHDFTDDRAIGPLIGVLRGDPDPGVRGNAAYALGGIGSPRPSRHCWLPSTRITRKTPWATRPVRARRQPSTTSWAPARPAAGAPNPCVAWAHGRPTWIDSDAWRPNCTASGRRSDVSAAGAASGGRQSAVPSHCGDDIDAGSSERPHGAVFPAVGRNSGLTSAARRACGGDVSASGRPPSPRPAGRSPRSAPGSPSASCRRSTRRAVTACTV